MRILDAGRTAGLLGSALVRSCSTTQQVAGVTTCDVLTGALSSVPRSAFGGSALINPTGDWAIREEAARFLTVTEGLAASISRFENVNAQPQTTTGASTRFAPVHSVTTS